MDTDYYTTLDSVQEQHWWYAARRTILERVLERVYAEIREAEGRLELDHLAPEDAVRRIV